MMKYLCNYAEYDEEDCDSMRNHFSDEPYDNKDLIVDYLKSGKATIISPGFAYDVFTGEKTFIREQLMNDGVYEWYSDLVYYVEKYNLRLPEEFEKHVLKRVGV